jgi:hypothetical protein
MKIIITETQNKTLLKRLRRIQEVRDTIDYQTEIQDPCNFDDGEEYADFCIGEGISFFYGDEDYEREDGTFEDEDEDEDNGRELIEQLMNEEYYDELVSLWEEYSEDC